MTILTGAYYFPGWRTNDPDALTFRPNPWASNDTSNDIYVGDTATFPDRKPKLGYFDETLQANMDQQIIDASIALDFFAFDWYWKTDNTAAYNHAITLFRSSPEKSRMQFCVNYINSNRATPDTKANWDAAVDTWITYFADAQYLRRENKPVVMLFDVNTYGMKAATAFRFYPSLRWAGQWATGSSYSAGDMVYQSSNNAFYECLITNTSGTFATDLAANKWVARISSGLTNTYYADNLAWLINDARARAVSAGYNGIYFVGCTSGHPFYSGTSGVATLAGFDAQTVYNYHVGYTDYTNSSGGGSATTVYDSDGFVSSAGSPTYEDLNWCYQKQWQNIVKSGPQTGIKYWLPLCAGWNKRAWIATASRYPTVTTAQATHDGNCTPTLAQWQRHINTAKTYLNYPQTDGIAIVYAWNEIGEGGFLIPTEGRESTFLTALATIKTRRNHL